MYVFRVKPLKFFHGWNAGNYFGIHHETMEFRLYPVNFNPIFKLTTIHKTPTVGTDTTSKYGHQEKGDADTQRIMNNYIIRFI